MKGNKRLIFVCNCVSKCSRVSITFHLFCPSVPTLRRSRITNACILKQNGNLALPASKQNTFSIIWIPRIPDLICLLNQLSSKTPRRMRCWRTRMKEQLVVGQMQIKMDVEEISLDPASVTGSGEGPDLELSSVAARHSCVDVWLATKASLKRLR